MKKAYFQDYRFSEDLDFSLKPEASIAPKDIENYLLEAFNVGSKLFGLNIDKNNIDIRPFPDKKGLFVQVKIPFQTPLMSAGSLPKVKLDLSKDELIVEPSVCLSLLHSYSDTAAVSTFIQTYSLNEIFAEKCRALAQRTRPRDLYDVVYLYENFYAKEPTTDGLLDLISLKFSHRELNFPEAFMQITQERFQEAQEAWSHMLSHQISNLGTIEHCMQKYEEIAQWLLAKIRM